jgi:hypothetical protein
MINDDIDDLDNFTEEEEAQTHKFITYFDILGFECLVDITSYERHRLLAEISGAEVKSPVNLNHMMMRARFNPQRNPEIWIFTSTVDEAILSKLAEDDPQALVDMIREHGHNVWGQTGHVRQVIK